jgi:hypothetical protein
MKIGRDEYRRAARIRVDNTHKKRETADRYFKIVDRGVLYLRKIIRRMNSGRD